MFKTETVEMGTTLPVSRLRFVNLPREWTQYKTGSILVDPNYEEQTFEFVDYYTERNGDVNIKCLDSSGFTRILFSDSVRLYSLTGKYKRSGKRESLLSEKEQQLDRTEKRRLRKERRDPIVASGMD
jgi:hypothetical protein